MAFQKKTWVNRIVQYPLRRLLTMVRPDDGSGTEIVDIQREDGDITQEGDAFSAENMNDLESRIESAFNSITIDVDDELDLTSENPVQNKVVTQALSTVDTKANAALANQVKSIEPGNTATANHSKGDYIVYGATKKFAEVLSNIAIGDPLTTGTGGNIENLTQGEVLTNLNNKLSHVGMIIQSTTLDTEAKVKAIYGSNTSWIQHSGYVLRGATSGVVANSATKTGGNDNAAVVQHSHSVSVSGGNHRHADSYDMRTDHMLVANTGQVGYEAPWQVGRTAQYTDYSGNLSMTGTANNNTDWSNGTNANIPNYKSVYIWERTV